MKNNDLTFNDLPMVVAQLRDEVMGMRQMLVKQQSENQPMTENRHQPMSLEQAVEYLQIPKGTLYEKLKSGEIPATKPGKRYVLYRDELDKWLETHRKNAVPLTAEEENSMMLALAQAQAEQNQLVAHGKARNNQCRQVRGRGRGAGRFPAPRLPPGYAEKEINANSVKSQRLS